jgi:hypothetical protein
MVSFWYQSDSSPYAPLVIKDSNEVPLYFYVNGNDFIFGNSAKDRFYSNDPNAFGNYFEIVKDPGKHFTIYGNKKPVKQLFYYGIEQYLSHFINQVLYKSDSIESYRQHFPLRFLFETDIEEKEKSLIINLFTEAGYYNVESIDYNMMLFEVLNQQNILFNNKSVLLLKGIDNVLFLELYKNIAKEPIGISKLEGQGADPRVKILAEMIIEYVSTQNPYLNINYQLETANILTFAASLLENITPIIKGEVEFNDGNKYWFRLNARILEERLLYASNESLIYTTIDDLLKLNGLNVEQTILLLGSEEINTSYFLNRLLKKYPNVSGIKGSCFNDAMKLIFSKIIEAGYLALKTIPSAPPIIPKQKIIEPILPEIKKPIIPTIIKTDEKKNNIKLPPILPPSNNNNISNDTKNNIPIIPKLPEPKKDNTNKNHSVIPPPLPQKKKTNFQLQLI